MFHQIAKRQIDAQFGRGQSWQNFHVGHHNGHQVRAHAVTMHVALSHVPGPGVDVFDLFRCNILTLGRKWYISVRFSMMNQGNLVQFKNVLLPVNQAQRALGGPGTNVSCVKPALLVQRFQRLRRVLVVTFEHVVTSEAHLALLVFGKIVHLVDVNQFDFVAGTGGTDMVYKTLYVSCNIIYYG